MSNHTDRQTLRAKLASGAFLVGSFVKTPAMHIVEIAGLAGLDFVLLDAEHAPFTVHDLDSAILAGRAAQVDVAVRIPSASPAWIQQALDLGADGIVIPHVSSVATARAMIAAAHFAGGSRGYSNSPRAGGYGTKAMTDHIEAADSGIAVIVQIEDKAGVECVEEIAVLPGIDALFIGRADLAVAYETFDPTGPTVNQAAERITAAAQANGIAVAGFCVDGKAFSAQAGACSMLVLGSDQLLLRAAWTASAEEVRLVSRQASD